MVIKTAKTIEEYKAIRDERIKQWIDRFFHEGSVTWEMCGASQIRVTDQTGDSMIVPLDDIC